MNDEGQSSQEAAQAEIQKTISDRGRKIDAILYAGRGLVLECVKATGHVPRIDKASFGCGFAHIIAKRGPDPELTPGERLVYDALVRDGTPPGTVFVDVWLEGQSQERGTSDGR
jgi:hypothetical protein